MNTADAHPAPHSRRRRVVFLVPLLAGLAPAVSFFISLRAAESNRPLAHTPQRIADFLLMPGVFPGLMFRSIIAQLLAAGVFWYLVGFTLLAAIFLPKPPRPREREGIYMRPLIILSLLLLAYAAFTARLAIRWNPD